MSRSFVKGVTSRAEPGPLELLLDRDDRAWDMGGAVRVQAVEALSDFYGSRVVSALAAALADHDPRVRQAAVKGLVDINSPKAADGLLGALAGASASQHPEERQLLLDALRAMDVDHLPERFVLRLLESQEGYPADGGRRTLEALLTADRRGWGATQALAHLLVTHLADQRPDPRVIAEEALGWFLRESIDLLIPCLRREPERLHAARLLGA
jgi:HEAT repeats